MGPVTDDLVLALLSAAFAAGGAYWAVRVELKFIWRDLGRLDARLAALEDKEG